MAGGFVTDASRVKDAANHVLQVRDEVISDINRLHREVETLSGAWKGAAAGAFGNLMAQWATDETKLRNAMTAIAELLDKTSVQYSTTEQDQHDAIQRVMGALNG